MGKGGVRFLSFASVSRFSFLLVLILSLSAIAQKSCKSYVYIFYFSSRKFVSTVLSSISCLIVNLHRALLKLAVYAKSDIPG